ncbi:MAG TPA: HAD family hydrolase, partial [Vicinamibacteria bacterium]|nr:HAD family hydrolase [Vicinamibacteria bacterium]
MSSDASPAPGAVLWDLDGTLVDSAPYHWLAWREAMAAVGHDLHPRDFARSFGQRNDAILRGLLGP